MPSDLVVIADPDSGVFGLLDSVKTAIFATGVPIGVVRLKHLPVEPRPARQLYFEVAFSEAGTIARLEAQLRLEATRTRAQELISSCLSSQGGSEFTSLCISDPAPAGDTAYRSGQERGLGEPRELCDLTVHFGSQLGLLARNTWLQGELVSDEERQQLADALRTLGIGFRERDRSLEVSRYQLRRKPSSAARLAAITPVVLAGLRCELYTSALPATRSFRAAVCLGDADHWNLSLALSRQPRQSAARDAVEVRDFLRQHFDFELAGERFAIDNTHGKGKKFRAHGPVPDRGDIQYSVNWGQKRS